MSRVVDSTLEHLEAAERRDFLRTFGRFGAAVTGALSILHAFTLHSSVSSVALALACGFMLGLPRISDRVGFRATAHLLGIVITALVSLVASLRGDLPLGALVYLVVLPLAVQYLAGARVAVAWTLVGVGLSGVATWRVLSGQAQAIPALATPEALASKDLFEASSIIGALALTTALALGLERRRRRVEAALTGRLAGRLRRLTGSVAHELNNPLAWMTSTARFLDEALRREPGPEREADLQECTTDLTEGVRRLGVFSEDLRALGPDARRPTADLARVLRLVTSLSGVQTRIDPAPRPTLALHVPEGALTEALVELVLRTSAPALSVALEGETVVFSISSAQAIDRGVLPEVLGPLFPFVTARDSSLQLRVPAGASGEPGKD
jgi:signal transduction histidine kinase